MIILRYGFMHPIPLIYPYHHMSSNSDNRQLGLRVGHEGEQDTQISRTVLNLSFDHNGRIIDSFGPWRHQVELLEARKNKSLRSPVVKKAFQGSFHEFLLNLDRKKSLSCGKHG